MSLGGRGVFKFSKWLGNLLHLLYIQVRQWLGCFCFMWQDYSWIIFVCVCGGSNYLMGTLKICFLIKIYQCLYYQLTRVKWTVIHRFNVNAGLRSFPPIEENKHKIWGEDRFIAWVWQYCRLLTDLIHQGELAASSSSGFCGVQKCCLKFQGDLLMSACCCSLLWSSFFSLGMAWKWFLWRQRILLQLPSVALLTSPCSLDSLWSSFGVS